MSSTPAIPIFFFFNDTATTEIYTLSLHDALPIFSASSSATHFCPVCSVAGSAVTTQSPTVTLIPRSEEHTSELQSQSNILCRLLLEKTKHRLNYLLHTQLRLLHQDAAIISTQPPL